MALPHSWVVLMLVLCLQGQVQTGRIIGGREAVPHSRPYMVLLELIMWNNDRTFCDGFLISDEFVLTAAHCKARIYHVHVGLHKFLSNSTPKGIEVRRAIPHEYFNRTTILHDLMLLQLSEKVNLTKNVNVIQLADRCEALPQRCLVSGWGRTGKYQMAKELREVNVTIRNDEVCAEHHSYCSSREPGPDKGDSGGPLVCEDGVAYGIVSFSHGNSAYYGRIPDYLVWIEHHLGKK